MTTMKAVRIRSFGGPEVLELADVEKPTPKDDEVLIRVRAASVNPVDYKIRSGGYPVVKQDQLPKVLGRDVAGAEPAGAPSFPGKAGPPGRLRDPSKEVFPVTAAET